MPSAANSLANSGYYCTPTSSKAVSKFHALEDDHLVQRNSPKRTPTTKIDNKLIPSVPDFSLLDEDYKDQKIDKENNKILENILPKFKPRQAPKNNCSPVVTPTHKKSEKRAAPNSAKSESKAEFKHLIQVILQQSQSIDKLESIILQQNEQIGWLSEQVESIGRSHETFRDELDSKFEKLNSVRKQKIYQNMESQTSSLYKGDSFTQTEPEFFQVNSMRFSLQSEFSNLDDSRLSKSSELKANDSGLKNNRHASGETFESSKAEMVELPEITKELTEVTPGDNESVVSNTVIENDEVLNTVVIPEARENDEESSEGEESEVEETLEEDSQDGQYYKDLVSQVKIGLQNRKKFPTAVPNSYIKYLF